MFVGGPVANYVGCSQGGNNVSALFVMIYSTVWKFLQCPRRSGIVLERFVWVVRIIMNDGSLLT
jgi:hypothetical protein